MSQFDRSVVRAVVFDKDGVLADSESINLGSAFEAFRLRGHRLDPRDEHTIVGKHPTDYVPLLARRFGLDEQNQRWLLAEQDVIYRRLWEQSIRMFDGAREALRAVRDRGLGVGLATSSARHEVDEFIRRF